MASTVEERPYIRQDGKEKVTGAGRYTADLTVVGQLHARFRYADHTRARILRIDASRARATSVCSADSLVHGSEASQST